MSDKKTEKNLKEAFAGESQASMKYSAFAAAADKAGYPGVARLFRAASESERIHAWAHLRNAGAIGDIQQNLQTAIDGETFEFTKMYPEMIDEAKKEDQAKAAQWFNYASEVEKGHAALYKKAMADPKALDGVEISVCSVCGYTVEGKPGFDKCPVCGAPLSAFNAVK